MRLVGAPGPSFFAMADGQPVSQAQAERQDMMDRRAVREHAYVKRKKEDTYRYRRMMGHPKHSQLSTILIIVSIVAFILQFMAIWMPMWRVSNIGVMGYNQRRQWGLWSVSGRTQQTHAELMRSTCEYYGNLNVGGICASPICLWYRHKCYIYIDMSWVSYLAGAFFCIGLFIHILCVWWTFALTPRLLRWASIWWWISAILHIISFTFFMIMTNMFFDSLNSMSFYPVPGMGQCGYLSMIAGCLVLACAVMGSYLRKLWPDPAVDDISEDESSTEDSEVDDEMHKRRLRKEAGMQPQMQPQQYMPPQQQQQQQWAQQQQQQQQWDPQLGQQWGHQEQWAQQQQQHGDAALGLGPMQQLQVPVQHGVGYSGESPDAALPISHVGTFNPTAPQLERPGS